MDEVAQHKRGTFVAVIASDVKETMEIVFFEDRKVKKVFVWPGARKFKRFADFFNDKVDKYLSRFPIVGFGNESSDALQRLVERFQTDIQRPFRYFDVLTFAKRNLPERNSDKWNDIMKAIGLKARESKRERKLTAELVGEMFIKIDAQCGNKWASIKRVFERFCNEITNDDGKIDRKEAVLLRCFAEIVSDQYPILSQVRSRLDEVLADDVVTPEESRDLICYLRKIIEEWSEK